jgi:hypothetical protein
VAALIRQASRDGLPTLEAAFHDPVLGAVRLSVRGLPDGPVEAQLVVASETAAAALERARRDPATQPADLAAVDLRVRVEPGPSHGAAPDVRTDPRSQPGYPDDRDGSANGLVGGDPSGRHDRSAGHGSGADAPGDGGTVGFDPSLFGRDGRIRSRRRVAGPGPTAAGGAAVRSAVPRRSPGIDLRL